ncbi:TetR/AcrR family transcriptional regulator [Arthrobacter globiformis]|uniref:TetR/AcrR family transcriptional regulator n=1 Tax=Arthrobacter globiformis TaxID=1665 RepID=UPI0027816AD2|nr:TetR/AcrR family transcriptional regulator [Arthrobacter globiformis]MDQ0867515.1 TetR/AcrR family transcriptional repressor of nem operon [Arthrobacter globiformis]
MNTRERILKEALELFHANGYNATGVLDITRAAGVPKGSFYHFFSSKEDLALEAVETYKKITRVELLDGAGGSALQRIRQHLLHLANMAEVADFSHGCLLGNFSTEMPSQSARVSAAVENALQSWTEHLAQAISEAQDAGEIRNAGDAARLASFVISGFEGSLSRAKVSGSREPLNVFFETVFRDILN